ncbi:hypothetical protein [Bradyrhizobium macuxiense]|uniref:hypothetical protein n=1 Tax=Bradyrhizobium macuxiense TaxID=1755647 RepID=UPI0010A95D4B|nr:hypothetical protein [Bradyrhizobium macuxiense]
MPRLKTAARLAFSICRERAQSVARAAGEILDFVRREELTDRDLVAYIDWHLKKVLPPIANHNLLTEWAESLGNCDAIGKINLFATCDGKREAPALGLV